MRLLTESLTLVPALSVAGVNRARLRISGRSRCPSGTIRSTTVTVQSLTRPSGPTSRRKPVVPCSSLRIAESRIVVVGDVGREIGPRPRRLDHAWRRRGRRPAADATVICGGGATGVDDDRRRRRVGPHDRRRRDHRRRRSGILLRRGRRLVGRGRRLILDVERLQILDRLLDDVIGQAGDQSVAERDVDERDDDDRHVRLLLICLRWAYDIKPQLSSKRRGNFHGRTGPRFRAPPIDGTTDASTYHRRQARVLILAIMAAQRVLFRCRAFLDVNGGRGKCL